MVADPIGSSRLSDGGEFGLRRIEKSEPTTENKKYTTVKVSQAAPLTYSGKVEAVRSQVLVPTSGKAQSVTVQNGDHVEQGQAVMTTFSESYEEQATEARQAFG